MQKKLKTSGNGWELYFSKPILKLLGYNPLEVKLLIVADGDILKVRPLQSSELDNFENHMVRKLQKSGGSYALYLPAPLLEVLDINPETDKVEISISGSSFEIKKVKL